MAGRSVLMLVNRTKPESVAAASDVRALICGAGHLLAELPAEDSPLPRDLGPLDLIVVLGGDGTLLAQSRRCIGLSAPLLGVNLGKVGFMAEFDLAALRSQAASLFGDGPLALRRLGLLHAEVHGPDAPAGGGGELRFSGEALNDVVVTAGPPFRLITLSLTIDGVPGPTVNGDGMIICTPTGSTAYNLSAGGPIVAPTVEAMAITPICAQSLSFRPIVVGTTSTVEVRVMRVNQPDQGQGTTLVLDGQVQTPLGLGDRILVTSHGQGVNFVRNPATDYWSRLIGKLHWAREPRYRA